MGCICEPPPRPESNDDSLPVKNIADEYKHDMNAISDGDGMNEYRPQIVKVIDDAISTTTTTRARPNTSKSDSPANIVINVTVATPGGAAGTTATPAATTTPDNSASSDSVEIALAKQAAFLAAQRANERKERAWRRRIRNEERAFARKERSDASAFRRRQRDEARAYERRKRARERAFKREKRAAEAAKAAATLTFSDKLKSQYGFSFWGTKKAAEPEEDREQEEEADGSEDE